MTPYDVKKAHRALYAPPAGTFTEVDVPPMRYLAVDGHGDPNTAPAYAQAVEALYAVAYAIRAARKAAGHTLVVAPLEALWRAEDPTAFVRGDKDAWDWTTLIAQPDEVTEDDTAAAVAAVAARRSRTPSSGPAPALEKVHLRTLHEGRSVQILHLGSYDDEAATLRALHEHYLPEHGLTPAGDHHEIYLSDARRTAPAKLRTVLRQPVR